MNDSSRVAGLAAAILSLSAIILAALGSHLIDLNGMQAIWQTALIIHLFNAAALMGLAALLARSESSPLKWGAWLIVIGTIVFCGSIYLHVITGNTIPKVTPSGGLLMMAGWALVILGFLRKS